MERKNEDGIGWDEYAGKLIRARNEKQAREMANKDTGDEGAIWDNNQLVSCIIVTNAGQPEIIITDFCAG